MKGIAFRLDRSNGKLWGVCAGIADRFGWDVTIVRVGLVVVTLLGAFPWTLIAYAATAFIAKDRSPGRGETQGAVGRTSTYEMRNSMREIDRRMAEVETHVTAQNGTLAREIEGLR